jgi:Zn-finger nucleic acid-binding protein
MRCVTCKEPMIVLEIDQVELDFCLSCAGIWLDSGELELLIADPSQMRAALILAANEKAKNAGSRKCPICRKRMDILKIGASSPIEIDCCPKNHGFWFDRGELEQIMSVLDKNNHSQVAQLLSNMFSDVGHKTKG